LQVTLPVGRHLIRVSKDKYEQSPAKPIQVDKNQVTSVSFKLVELTVQPGFLEISSTPGASVKVDGVPWGTIGQDGKARVQVAPKASYVLEIQASNSDLWKKTVGPVRADQALPVTASLTFKPLPVVDAFTGPTEPVVQGQSAKITWKTSNARSVDIDGIGQNLNPNDSKEVAVSQNTTFTLIAKGEGGSSAARTLSVTVKAAVKPPSVLSFRASPARIQQGESTTLTWSTTDAQSVTIDNGIGTNSANGSRQVTPTQNTTYQLTASGPGGSANFTTSVIVDAKPQPTQPAPLPVVDQTAKEAAEIKDALNRLSAAYATQLVSEVKKEWTGMTKEQEKAVGGVFSNEGFKAVAIQYDGCSAPSVNGDTAVISCTETTSWTADKKRSSHPMPVSITLKKISGVWKVENKFGK